jgi:Flp pilus assembly protein TadG
MKECGFTLRKFMRAHCGATAVEFALVAPVFLIMAIGIFEMGRAMWIKATMQYAVEETTRYAIVNTSATTAALETYATSVLTDMSFGYSADVTFTATEAVSGSVTYKQILGSYSFSVMVPLVPFPDVTLSVKSRVPVAS